MTGGFKTVYGMVKTLESVDGVGLGKPVYEESIITADILSGKVKGAIVSKIDQDDFPLTIVAAVLSLGRLGTGWSPQISPTKKKCRSS